MTRKGTALGIAVAAALGTAGVADASTYNATLVVSRIYGRTGSQAGNQSSSTATWSYDDATNLLSQTGGTYNVRFVIAPTTTLFRHTITGLVIGNSAAATASTFSCLEGGFGSSIGASICGNYEFGANFTNESSTTWGPATASARTIGGDDFPDGPQQAIGLYNSFTQVSFFGTSLILSNATCDLLLPGNANNCAPIGGFNTGFTWTLDARLATPLPAAAWLFGGALGALGWLKRKAPLPDRELNDLLSRAR